MIHLHRASAHDDSISFEKCSQAARLCVTVMKQIPDQDYPFLDPVLAVSTLLNQYHFWGAHSVGSSRVGQLLQTTSLWSSTP